MESISKWWRYSVLIVIAVGFSVLGFVTKLTYENAPPVPLKVVDPSNNLVFSGDHISNGQNLFFKYNLMELGTLWGHGAYLGPDFSAEYLHQETGVIRDLLSRNIFGVAFDNLSEKDRGTVSHLVIQMIKQNRYDPATQTLIYSEEQIAAFQEAVQYWSQYFKEGAPGQPANYIQDPQELHDLTAFFPGLPGPRVL